jgi:outer membrane PBP1 activator LpoA protein
MKRLILFCSIILALVLTACAAQPSSEQTVKEGDGPIVTVYRAPT